MRIRYRRYVVGALMVVLTACAGAERSPQARASQSPGPALMVERFLRAANANDLETMTQLFGTTDRTIVQLEGQQQAEERMYVLASLLRHDDWSIQGQQTVPGRMVNATELMVRLKKGDVEPVVPFLVVRRSDGGWIIERIDVEAITGARR